MSLEQKWDGKRIDFRIQEFEKNFFVSSVLPEAVS